MKTGCSKLYKYSLSLVLIFTPVFTLGIFLPTGTNAQTAYDGSVSFEEYTDQLERNELNKTNELSIPAQIPELKEQISVDISPEIPAPFQEVTITISAFGTDLNRAQLDWSVNGTEKLTGIGERVFTYKVGGIGSKNQIRVEIAPISGPTIIRNFNFTPGEVDVIWEALTYTPPFYKGKAMFTPEAKASVVALPNLSTSGVRLNPKQSAFNWKFDYRADASKSGYGKDIYSYQGSILKKEHVFEVESYDPKNTATKGVGIVALNEQVPLVLVYYNDPLLGVMFNKQASNLYLGSETKELSISAFPLFQSVADRRLGNYSWFLNGDRVNVFNDQPTVSLRKEDVGDKSIRLRVDSSLSGKILQSSQNEINILQ